MAKRIHNRKYRVIEGRRPMLPTLTPEQRQQAQARLAETLATLEFLRRGTACFRQRPTHTPLDREDQRRAAMTVRQHNRYGKMLD